MKKLTIAIVFLSTGITACNALYFANAGTVGSFCAMCCVAGLVLAKE